MFETLLQIYPHFLKQ